MRTTPHASQSDRRSLPRLLVGRPATIQKVKNAIADIPPTQFDEGEMITFVCGEGWRHIITILRIRPYGAVDVMAYDGTPHHIPTTVKALRELKIVARRRMDENALAEYCRLLDIEQEPDIYRDAAPSHMTPVEPWPVVASRK